MDKCPIIWLRDSIGTPCVRQTVVANVKRLMWNVRRLSMFAALASRFSCQFIQTWCCSLKKPSFRSCKFRILVPFKNLFRNIQQGNIRSRSRLLTVQHNPQAAVFHCLNIRMFQVFQVYERNAREGRKNEHIPRQIPTDMLRTTLHPTSNLMANTHSQ